MRFGWLQETWRRHEDVNSFRGSRSLGVGSMRFAASVRSVFAARRVSGSRVGVLAVSCADGGRWSSGVGGQTGCEAKVELGSAVPHTFDAWGEAVDGLLVVLVGVH
jgi:hypothetical protein